MQNDETVVATCPNCGGKARGRRAMFAGLVVCPKCGATAMFTVDAQAGSQLSGAPGSSAPAPGQLHSGAVVGEETGDPDPSRNVPALVACYLGVLSVIPLFPIGIAAFVLGIAGYLKCRRDPSVRGGVHAWIGIIVGGVLGVLWAIVTLVAIVVVIAKSNH